MPSHLKVTLVSLLTLVTLSIPTTAMANSWDAGGSNAGASDNGDGAITGFVWVPTPGTKSAPGEGGGSWRPATQVEIREAQEAQNRCLNAAGTDQAKVNACLATTLAAVTPPPSPAVIISSAKTQIQLPLPTPVIEPAPNRNEWNMVAVGFPLWLHLAGPTEMRSTATVQGFSIALVAARGPVTFTMGDGSQVVCGRTTPWNINQAGLESPTCGYTYQTKSLPEGSYTVTATTTWTINWSGAGQSGTFTVDLADSVQLPVGELQTVVTGR